MMFSVLGKGNAAVAQTHAHGLGDGGNEVAPCSEAGVLNADSLNTGNSGRDPDRVRPGKASTWLIPCKKKAPCCSRLHNLGSAARIQVSRAGKRSCQIDAAILTCNQLKRQKAALFKDMYPQQAAVRSIPGQKPGWLGWRNPNRGVVQRNVKAVICFAQDCDAAQSVRPHKVKFIVALSFPGHYLRRVPQAIVAKKIGLSG